MKNSRAATLDDVLLMLTKVKDELTETRREVRILRRVIRNGGVEAHPWENLSKPRRNQVARVYDYLKSHPDRSVHALPTATEKTFVKIAGGYPNPKACYNYCHSVGMLDLV